MDKILWNLFKTTGDYRYYMMLKRCEDVEYEEIDSNGDKKSKGNNN